jgi:hypothetical protein
VVFEAQPFATYNTDTSLYWKWHSDGKSALSLARGCSERKLTNLFYLSCLSKPYINFLLFAQREGEVGFFGNFCVKGKRSLKSHDEDFVFVHNVFG